MSKSLNLSPVSFQAWLKLVFDHPVPRRAAGGAALPGVQWHWAEEFRVSDKTRLVAHVTRMCREFRAISRRFSARQIDQGVWFLLGAGVEFGECLASTEVNVDERVDCVRAMLHPFSNYVALSRVHVMENCFAMWWDLLPTWFWMSHLNRLKGAELAVAYELELEQEDDEESRKFEQFLATVDPNRDWNEQFAEAGFTYQRPDLPSSKITICYEELEAAEQRVVDAMLDTLTQILHLEEERCVYYALHGLNHLKHPRRAAVVQEFLERHKRQWNTESLAYAQSCRDGEAM